MDDCERLAAAIDRKHAVLDELRELGRRQLELIAVADLSSLLRVLAGKQRLVEQLQSIELDLDRFRHQQPAERRWQRAEDRIRCAQILLRCESLIGEIIEQERRSEVELAHQREDAAGRLALLQSADEAHGAYGERDDDAGQLDIVSDR
jgi:flagellar biosynthesis/type III secretory pathway chaperone